MIFQKSLKTFLLLSVSWLQTTLALSQPSTIINLSDSNKILGVKKGAIVKVLSRAYEADGYQQQNSVLLAQVDTLKARITIKENIISTLNANISDYQNIVRSKDAIISNQEDQKRLYKSNQDALNRQLRKQRNKTKWTAFVGIVATSAALTLFLTK